MIQSAGAVCLALLFVTTGVPAQEKYRGGIVYGPKAAFDIAAPEGWVLDNESGKNQGLPCVLYPKGQSWAHAKTVMYADIEEEFEDVNQFVATRDQKNEGTARHAERENRVRQNQRRPRLLHQRISCDKDLLAVGARGLRPTSARGRLHRSFIARRSELPQGFSRAAGSS
jgi:hypothetical protein